MYKTITKVIEYLCTAGKTVAVGTLATFGACQVSAPAAQPMGAIEQLDLYKKSSDSYNKDRVINQDEVPRILADLDAIKAFKETLIGSDKVTALVREEATGIEGTLNGYLTSLQTDKRLKANLAFVTKRDLSSSNRPRGFEKNDKIAYNGTASEHMKDLGVTAEDVYRTMQADYDWGFEPGKIQAAAEKAEKHKDVKDLEAIKNRIATGTIEVSEEKWSSVTKYFPSGGIRAKDGTRYTAEKFNLALKKNEIVSVRLVYVLEPAVGVKTEEEKADDKLLERLEQRIEEKKPAPAPVEKKGKGVGKFDSD